jgi:cytochrome bd-type quinol oxidase subunit 1
MGSNTLAFLGVLIVMLLVCAGIVVLQIYLSKKENKWAGLILPIVSLSFALIAAIGIVGFFAHTGTQTATVDGEVIERSVNLITPAFSIVASAAYAFLLYNIPTIILYVIYASCRGKHKRQRDLGKMSIQDLE